ncbi:PQQ-dependent sugar dehydrogenase [Actinophytocola sp.]|uniref:PQQ-dependent sugar dehydrogenase n=1 Tax=Actinophytocola sp. TaxID=1872138 RepID=UPI002DDD28C9|nr:PQQ-dependent sugar dehydrogenase [Actinophytocola sp.]
MSGKRRGLILSLAVGVVAAGLAALPSTVAGAVVPPGFSDTAVITGLTQPTAAAFAPDGRVFIAEKSGILKVFDSLTDTTPTIAADLRPAVQDFWDRGLLGLALDPQFPTRPYAYVLYSYDALPGGTHPRWGDQCPTPPGATDQGCVITGRLAKLTLDATGVSTNEQVLITDWCQQYPSHSIGSVVFGPDGQLYVGGGDGASFNFADYGQVGNPCGDPPGAAGTNLSPPTARGGALRSQSPRRPAGEPTTPDGTILRVHPDTGARSIIAYGMRNQFRFGFRPNTNELWAGDVGWNTWEEINRIPDATDAVVENFGWPCFEGTGRQSGYDDANLTLCESLYSGGGQTAPYYAYNHSASVVAGDGCPTGGSSIAGIAFENGSNYPAAYAGALFFADASRGCIWAMQRGATGQPDPARLVALSTGVGTPVHLSIGPGGDLFYVALGAGELRRISYPGGTNRPPTAVATATPSAGPAPLTVQFDGTRSTDPDVGDTLTYAWDLDGDGAYDDSTAARPSYTYIQQALVTVGLKVTDPAGLFATTTVQVAVDDPPTPQPVVTIDDPTTALRWQVGQTVPFSGRAADAQDGTLPPSALSWRLTLQHCTTATNCHAHVVQSFPGVASGSFVAPDHEYPSYLDLTLTATDSDGNSASTTVRLDPRTVVLNFTSNPSQVLLTVGGVSQRTPFSRTVIVGSNNSISAPSPQNVPPLNLRYRWVRWSDGGAQTHNITAPASTATYQATYQWCALGC